MSDVTPTRLLLLVGAAAVLLTPSHAARAGPDEIEDRLLRTELVERDRQRVHASIARAVRYFDVLQLEDGSFPVARDQVHVLHAPGRVSRVESTSVAAAALAHVDSSRSRELADRAIEFLILDHQKPRLELRYRVAPAALTVMALSARDTRPKARVELTARLQGAQDDDGFWAHNMNNGSRGRVGPEACFLAILGIRSAELRGAPTWTWIWRKRLKSMHNSAHATAFATPRSIRAGSVDPAVCQGIAAAVLCRARLSPKDRQRAGGALHPKRLESTFDEWGARVLESLRGEREPPRPRVPKRTTLGQPRTQSLFDLFSLSAAGLLLEKRRTRALPWMSAGVEYLLSRQNDDGGWGPGGRHATSPRRSDVAETAWALLFLTRAASTLHPERPQPVRRPATAPDASVTGVESPQPTPRSAPSPAPALAWGLLEEVEQLLDDRRASAALVRAAIEDLRFTYEGLRRDRSTRAEAWRRGAELLLLRAVTEKDRLPPPGTPRPRTPDRDPAFQSVAAAALGSTHRRVSTPLRDTVDRTYLGDDGRPEPKEMLLETFATLARLGDPHAATWVLRTGMRDAAKPAMARRALAALNAVARWRNLEPADRLLLAWSLVQVFAEPGDEEVQPRSFAARWPGHLRPAGLRALRNLCVDPATDRIPGLDRWTCSLEDLEAWLRFHDDPSQPPWTPSKVPTREPAERR